jgi:hypothetical protein
MTIGLFTVVHNIRTGGSRIRNRMPRPRRKAAPRHNLRSKLAEALPEWTFIHTHFGFGYRFQPERSHLFHKTATGR